MASALRVPVHIVYKHMKNFHLKGVKKVKLSFDPFHKNVESVRQMVFLMNVERVRSSNESCTVKTDILSDMSEPQMDVEFADGKKSQIKTTNLSVLEIMDYFSEVQKEIGATAEQKK